MIECGMSAEREALAHLPDAPQKRGPYAPRRTHEEKQADLRARNAGRVAGRAWNQPCPACQERQTELARAKEAARQRKQIAAGLSQKLAVARSREQEALRDIRSADKRAEAAETALARALARIEILTSDLEAMRKRAVTAETRLAWARDNVSRMMRRMGAAA